MHRNLIAGPYVYFNALFSLMIGMHSPSYVLSVAQLDTYTHIKIHTLTYTYNYK